MIKKDLFNPSDRYHKNKNQVKGKFTDQQTGSDTPKKISFKNNFIYWLKNLPLDERYLVSKVNAPGLAKRLQDTLIDLQNEQTQQSKKDMQINKRLSSKFSKQIIEAIILISDGQQFYENIGFDFSYIEQPDKLYELLTFNLPQAQKQMLLTQQYDIDVVQLNQTIQKVLDCKSKQDLASDMINFMRSEIFLKFEEKRPINLEEQKNRKKEFSIFWRNLSEDFKTKILLLHKQDLKSLLNFLHDRKIYLDFQQLEKQINQLVKMEKNEFCNKIFKCKLRRSLNYMTEYYQLIYKAWKNELTKRRQRKFKNTRIQQNEKTVTTSQSSTSLITIDKNAKRLNKIQNEVQNPKMDQGVKRKKNKNRRKKSTSAQSKQTKATSYKLSDEVQKQQKLQQQIKQKDDILSSQIIEKIEYPLIDFQKQGWIKIGNDIQEYSDLINEEANEFYERRVIAYKRIQFMLSVWKIPIKLFGSCASGITIKNSDIDIAVDNSILNYFINLPQNNRLKAALEQLQVMFQQQPWITSLKLIKTAAIPVIKMKVDTSILFINTPHYEIPEYYIQQLNRDHSSKGQIHIDLTIETINKDLQSNHLGIISTDSINKWLRDIKCLHPIVILIKNYLTKTNLNVTYEGGLNTYSMLCMLVSYILDQKLQNQTEVAKVLKQVLKFYAFEFDQKIQGIDLADTNQIFYDKLKISLTKSMTEKQQQSIELPNLQKAKSVKFCQADLQIKDPLNNGKNMTKNCYSFPKIKQIFKQIYETCFLGTQALFETKVLEKLEQKKIQWQNQKIKQEQIDSRVRQLLKECRQDLSNPFLTLFE